jgi:hypothetical protein
MSTRRSSEAKQNFDEIIVASKFEAHFESTPESSAENICSLASSN